MPLVDIIQCVIELAPGTTMMQALDLAKRYGLEIKSACLGQNGNGISKNLPLPDGLLPPYVIASTINQGVEQIIATIAGAGSIVNAVYWYKHDSNEPTKWKLM